MRFELHYKTEFEYENVVRHSQNELRACPASDEFQSVLSYRVHATPAARFHSFTDYWGTRVDAYGIREPHVAVSLVAEATVETRPRPLVTASPSIAELDDPAFADPLVEYLDRTRHTIPGQLVVECAEEIRSRSDPDVVSLVLGVHRRVHRSVSYQPGSTVIGISADDVLAGGVGVCQDYAHLAVSVCRVLRIPARYVSGYFFASDDRSGEISGDTASVQTHAWFEAAIPGAGWLALDPTNALAVGERHITIGRGRDYDDVPPIRGAYAGAANASVIAGVEMRRLGGQGSSDVADPGQHLHQQIQQQQ